MNILEKYKECVRNFIRQKTPYVKVHDKRNERVIYIEKETYKNSEWLDKMDNETYYIAVDNREFRTKYIKDSEL